MFATCRVSCTMEILTLMLPSRDFGHSQQSGSHDDSRSPPENWGHPWFPGSRPQECGLCSWQGTGWQSKCLYLRNGAHESSHTTAGHALWFLLSMAHDRSRSPSEGGNWGGTAAKDMRKERSHWRKSGMVERNSKDEAAATLRRASGIDLLVHSRIQLVN